MRCEEKQMIIVDRMTPSPLGQIPHHQNAVGVERFAPSDAVPLQLSAHRVANPDNQVYCDMHSHDNLMELNLILPSQSGMRFDVSDGANSHQITSPTALWIPPNVSHQANAVSGSGWFVCLRLPAGNIRY